MQQTTLHRILSGKTASPRGQSLTAIADYFKVSINDLLNPHDLSSIGKNRQQRLPVLEWIDGYLENHQSALSNQTTVTDAKVSDASFALKMNDKSMELQFPQGAMLIFDPYKKPVDRCYALVHIKKEKMHFFRQLVCSGSEQYLKALSADLVGMPLRRLESGDKIVAVLAQARIEY